MTTDLSTDVEWPAWEDAAFYNQDFDTIFASIAAQRHAAPVYWYEPPNFATGFWVLSKWEHQRFVGSHPELFSSRYGFAVGDASEPSTVVHLLPEWAKEALDRPGVTPADARGIVALGKLSMGDPNFASLILSDPPRHGQIRDIMMKALKPSLVRSQKGRIAEITDAFLDDIQPGVATDFVTSIGHVPAALMTDLIGVPADMRERFIEMSSAQMAAITIDANRDPDEADRIQRSAAAFHDYCDALLAERRADAGAGDDLVSVVARSEWEGAPVPDGMAISFIHTFVNAGETTRAPLLRGADARGASRAAAPPRRGAGPDPQRRRGSAAVPPAQLDGVPHGHPGPRARRSADQSGRLRGDGVREREPRRGRLGTARRVRRHALVRPRPPGVRLRRALVPRARCSRAPTPP